LIFLINTRTMNGASKNGIFTKMHKQKEEVIGMQWVSKQEMLEFVRDMDYRTEDYRAVVEAYIERSIGEGPQPYSAEQLP